MTIKECVKKYTVYLKNITHIPAKEVEILIMHLLDKNVIWLHLNYDKAFTKELELEKLVKKRATNFPLEYIIKKASFYGEQFFTDEEVLIPRPETELLVENAFEILKDINTKEKAIKVHRQGDSWATHCCGPACHASNLASGSSTVFVNGKQIGRIGDPVACGSVVAVGSGNVFAN
jgi:methylase of polypeptide subunit release factors